MSGTRAWISFLVLELLRVALVRAQLAPPPIIAPRSGDVWPVGSTQTIKWSTQGVQVFQPDGKPIPGTILLGHLTNDTGGSGFFLWVETPLANGFPLANQEVQVVVPDVPTASDYFIAMDISNNLSQLFTIQNPKDPKGTSAEPSTISVSTLPFSSFSVPATGSAAASSSTTSASGSSGATASSSSGASSATSATSSAATSSTSSQSTATVLTGTSTRPSSGSATSTGSGSPSSTPTNAATRVAGHGLAFLSSVFAVLLLA
ncbi:hypothetical protein PYCCODRAFT_1430217 [Trametes coccinea BRFM310]|uniref:Ser-Thr-rich glycosyl-phosphatidyl-inositol-anchored membrane family-domain-containing protein n=1 Tax=Trametes coccinea (strain BRFM310) TaxID=1353009 RepID=A0A1Y2J3P2_TRAC3|nr:hypothetical protein PYCCODRAFT_1430217 [Trametes coccinea BRFM310]